MAGDININLPDLPPESQSFIRRIFGPLAELGDLLSEKIRFYRWQSSLEMMDRANIIAHERNFEVNEIPFRKLVPLLEKSSLEELSSPLLDRWAELLALASHDESKVSISFIDILSRIDVASVKLLDRLTPDEHIDRILEGCNSDNLIGLTGQINAFLNARIIGVEENIFRDCMKFPEPNLVGIEGFKSYIQNIFYRITRNENFVPMPELLIANLDRGDEPISTYCYKLGLETATVDSLQSVGLVERHVALFTADRFRLKFVSVMPTSLGIKFVMACRGKGISYL